MEVNDFSKWLTKGIRDFESNSQKELKKFLIDSKDSLKKLAPVDSGGFRDSWEFEFSKSSGSLYNKTAHGTSIELGSKPGQQPWPSPGPKTAMSNGRIFSTQAIDGTIDKVINEKSINDLAKSVSKLVEVFK